MTTLTAKRRAAIPSTQFGLPAERKYPMPDANHARNAKARASEEYNAGNLSAGQKMEIFVKANRNLGIRAKSA